MLKPSYLSDEYLVSDDGYVLCKNKKHKLHGSKNHHGYVIVTLMVNGKRISVQEHKLVAMAFCDGYKDGLQVNHKNGVRTDNRTENLEWCTPSYNVLHSKYVLKHDIGSQSKFSRAVNVFNHKTGEFIKHYNSVSDACRDLFDVNIMNSKDIKKYRSAVWRVMNGIRLSYKGYEFTYA